MVLNTGPVAEAVRASISIPGLFEPFFTPGSYYVDGGAVNPVPCSVLAQHGANIIIAVNVTAEPERVAGAARGDRAAAGSGGKGRGVLPSIVEALMGSLETDGVRDRQDQVAPRQRPHPAEDGAVRLHGSRQRAGADPQR